MSNLTDALIAAKLIGAEGGGSGGGSGLPPITTETVEILAEQSVAFAEDGGIYMGSVAGEYSISVGDTITATWDGTPYECVVGELQGFPVWGNLSLLGMGADTGEPFLMMYNSGETNIGMFTVSDAATHTVELSSTAYNPPMGSIIIAEDGEWTEKRLPDYLPARISISSATAVTVAAKNVYVFTGAVTAIGAPASWKTCECYGANLIANGDNNPTGLQIATASLDLTAGTAQIVFVNNTGSSITATGGFNTGGLFIKMS